VRVRVRVELRVIVSGKPINLRGFVPHPGYMFQLTSEMVEKRKELNLMAED